MNGLSIARLGQALGLFLALLYALCVAWDGVFASWAMHSVWAGLLPGFHWLSAGDFFLGLTEAYLYGWIAAALFAPIWNLIGAERPQTRPHARQAQPHSH